MAKILDSKPSRDAASPPETQGFSLIPREKLIAIYSAMLKCRLLEQKAAALFQGGRLDADLHSSSGSEACAASVCADLQPEDSLCIEGGDWLPAFAKGLPAETLFRALAPKDDGHQQAVCEELQRRNIVVHERNSDQPHVVLHRAEAAQAEKHSRVVAAFLSARADFSDWQKVMTAAASRKLPLVFVHHVLDGQELRSASSRGKSNAPEALIHGMPVIAVDADDPVALYRVAYEAITRARQRRGATLLECASIPFVPASNEPLTQPPDPLSVIENYLKTKGVQPEPYNRKIIADFTRDLDLATRFLDR
jgi:TPP-dependent pyruvate/acetoin dehydrogenase alpha subunit